MSRNLCLMSGLTAIYDLTNPVPVTRSERKPEWIAPSPPRTCVVEPLLSPHTTYHDSCPLNYRVGKYTTGKL